MREYKSEEAMVLDRIICNGCGRIIAVRHGIPEEGVFQVRQVWEYLSGKDGEIDQFDLCEDCYDKMTEQFAIPLTKTELIELV